MSKVHIYLSFQGQRIKLNDVYHNTTLAQVKDKAISSLGLVSKKDYILYSNLSNLSFWEGRSLEKLLGKKDVYELVLVNSLSKSDSVSTDNTERNMISSITPIKASLNRTLNCSCILNIASNYCRNCRVLICESCKIVS